MSAPTADPTPPQPATRAEAGFERVLWGSRLVVLAAVGATVALAVGALILATVDTVRLVGLLADYIGDPEDAERVGAVTTIVKALDGYLIAALLLVVAFGLYELFVSPIDPAGSSPTSRRLLRVRDLEDLKQRVGKLVVLVLIGELLQQALKLPVADHLDLVYLGAAVVAIAVALYLTGRWSEHRGAE